MGRLIDLANKRFGRLFVVERNGKSRGQAAWRCWCDCGQETTVSGYRLRTGETQSCGCLHREVSSQIYTALNATHGMSGTREHNSWRQMKSRCFDPNHKHFKHYGGRGVTVCERWRDSFETFLEDLGPRPDGKTLDRIDVNGNYEPVNCRWATVAEQNRNRRKKTPDGLQPA